MGTTVKRFLILVSVAAALSACGTTTSTTGPSPSQQLSAWKSAKGQDLLANAKDIVHATGLIGIDSTGGSFIGALSDCLALSRAVQRGQQLTPPPIAAAASRFDTAYSLLGTGANDCINAITNHVSADYPKANVAIRRGLNEYLAAVHSLPAS